MRIDNAVPLPMNSGNAERWLLNFLSMLVLRYSLSLVILFFGIVGNAQPAARTLAIELPAVHFSDPTRLADDLPDYGLLQVAENLIEAVPAGDTIYLSMFKFDEAFLAEALIEAQERGVVVNLLLDDGKTSDETNEDIMELLDGRLHRAYFFRNDISKKAIFHNKFLLFSRLITSEGIIERVVLQTSSNFQQKDTEKWQDLLLVSHGDLYAAYRDYWRTIEALGAAGSFEPYTFHHHRTADGRFHVFFLPMRREGEKIEEDLLVNLLDRIQDSHSTHIRIAMAKWDEKRDDLIDRFKTLAEQGAVIEILLDKNVEEEVREELEETEEIILVRLVEKDIRLHSKFFLVETTLEGIPRRFVFTGSQNFTNRSLNKNFETVLMVEDEGLYRQYLDGYLRLRSMDE